MIKLKRKLFLARKNWRTLTLVFAGAFLGTGLIFSGINIIGKLVSAAPTVPVPSISLTSQHTSYASNTPGAWNVTKSAKWTSVNTAKITFEVDTIAKISENMNYDIVFVADISGSMSGDKLAQVKADASELAESLLSDNRNRIALVSFESEAHIESGFTSDKNLMLQKIDALSDKGCTNYYDGLVKAEEVLEGYTQQPNRELILLFLTDGYPNMDTPNEIGQYELLKQKYPYMIINGIQYEMGAEVLDPVKAVSDYQYIATMTDLNNVLFEASVAPYAYDEFVLTDFINDEYFSLGDISNIFTDKGSFSLDYDGNTPKITWDLSGLRSGSKVKMTIDITLKDGQYAEDRLYPTNKSTSVETSLADTSSENITTSNTPILKNDYDVIYDPNTPSGCVVTGMPATLTEPHRVFETVALTDAEPTCAGYNFTGFDSSNTDVRWLNDDFFIMPGSDVTLRATWTKVSMEKSMDGTVRGTVTAVFDTGITVSAKMKKLSGDNNATSHTENTTIKAIKRSDLLSDVVDLDDSQYILSSTTSEAPIFGWFNELDETIYYYTEADKVSLDVSAAFFFAGLKSLTDISTVADWETSNTQSMTDMFYKTSSLTDISALSNWNTSNVRSMQCLFQLAESLTSVDALENWNTSNVTDMSSAFLSATSLTDISALSNWDTSNVRDMTQLFSNTTSLSDISPLSSWTTSSVTEMDYMFSIATSITDISSLSNWDTSNVTNMSYMFNNARSLTNISGLSNWNTSSVKNMSNMFNSARSLANISSLSNWNTSSVTNMNSMFNNTAIVNIDSTSGWSTSSVTTMNNMFRSASLLSNINGAANWNVSNVTDMAGMFGGTAITNIDSLSGWNTANLTTIRHMFDGANSLTNINGAANWNVSNVTDMGWVFNAAKSLTNISGATNWNTSNVTDMGYMFSDAAFTDIDALANWNTSNVTDLSYLFHNVDTLTNVNGALNWSTSQVTTLNHTFAGCKGLADISGITNWDVSNVTNMNYLFYQGWVITDLSPIYDWDTSSLTETNDMFYGVPSSVTRPSWYQ